MQFSQRHLELEEELGNAQNALAELNEKHSQLLKRLEERERKITELTAELQRSQQVHSRLILQTFTCELRVQEIGTH